DRTGDEGPWGATRRSWSSPRSGRFFGALILSRQPRDQVNPRRPGLLLHPVEPRPAGSGIAGHLDPPEGERSLEPRGYPSPLLGAQGRGQLLRRLPGPRLRGEDARRRDRHQEADVLVLAGTGKLGRAL